MKGTFVLLLAAAPWACWIEVAPPGEHTPQLSMDTIAEEFVKLTLALGRHDADYVDAYLGPEEWKEEAEVAGQSVEQIQRRARELHGSLAAAASPSEPLSAQRQRALLRSLESLIARTEMLSGIRFSFDQESLALYDAQAPIKAAEEFQRALGQLDKRLPGNGSLMERYTAFKHDFVIPPEKLDPVFQTAIAACRAKTTQHIDLPDGESFVVEYVTDKSWSGYNWYKGDYHSLIQVNTDLPIYIDRAIDLACHEGYPGHHVYNLLVERELVKKRGWKEFLVYPLFSPRSLIAEGTANFGIEIAFPEEERSDYERQVLFPLAGLDPRRATEYYDVLELADQLKYAGNEAARGVLDGEMDAAAAVEWLSTYAMMTPARAKQRLRFIEQYRSYVINYNLGQDLVRNHIERRGGTVDQADVRWREFATLLSAPTLPSDLQ